MGTRGFLGEFEHMVLLAVLRLGTNAYGMRIRQELEERGGRSVSVGAVYTTLERLEEKGFVLSHRGEATPKRGGRAKIYFRIAAPGSRVLRESRDSLRRMWSGVKVPAVT